MMFSTQSTLASPVTIQGRGIHSGAACAVRVLPAEPDYGIRFVRVDLAGSPEIPVCAESIAQEPQLRQTILRAKDNANAMVCTVEHLLASLYGLGIANARIEMTAAEFPIGDGSASEIARALAHGGVTPQTSHACRALEIPRPIVFSPAGQPDVEFTAWPSRELTITYFLYYDHPVIGAQNASFTITPETFASEIAPARTFCTMEEVEMLRAAGLIRGGTPDNAIVVGRDRILNTTLLWDNELARHKLLDLLGDLYLLGAPLRGHVVAYRSGHQANAQFIDYLRKELA